MDSWNRLSAGLGSLNIGQSTGKLAKGFSSTVQATREKLGQVSPDEITELPQEYKDLENRVDALKQAHLALLRVAKVYESETYDYPTQIQESISELSTSISRGVTNFAATNLKNTNLPALTPAPEPVTQHKTLPHALARSARSAASDIGTGEPFPQALNLYAQAWETIASARLQQDAMISAGFLAPWNQTLNTSIMVAMRARAAVRVSRLELDAAKASLKSTSPAKQEQARLEVENAEDDLVQKTEVAITLMKNVLDNPEPVKNLNELIKAQLLFHSKAAEVLNSVQGDIEELSVAAEGEYRKSRDH